MHGCVHSFLCMCGGGIQRPWLLHIGSRGQQAGVSLLPPPGGSQGPNACRQAVAECLNPLSRLAAVSFSSFSAFSFIDLCSYFLPSVCLGVILVLFL